MNIEPRNIACAFARKWSEAWAKVEEEIPNPLQLNEFFEYEPASGYPFRLLLIASALKHKDTLTEVAKTGIVRTALGDAITIASDYGLKSIATAIMTGGWRLSQQCSFLAMTEGHKMASQAGRDIAVDICIMDTNQYETI